MPKRFSHGQKRIAVAYDPTTDEILSWKPYGHTIGFTRRPISVALFHVSKSSLDSGDFARAASKGMQALWQRYYYSSDNLIHN